MPAASETRVMQKTHMDPSHAMLSILVPMPLVRRLKAYCIATRYTQQEVVERWLTESLDREDPTGKTAPQVVPQPQPQQSADPGGDRLAALERQMEQLLKYLSQGAGGQR